MGTPREPRPVRFFTSVIYADPGLLGEVTARLRDLLGPVEETTAPAPFTHTDYYCREMGGGLERIFMLFTPLKDRGMLPEVKLATNLLEEERATEGRRKVNIDPGYLSLEQVVLATTKGYTHRIYLGRGLFADLTLMYGRGTYRPLDWTYPDYGGGELIALFNRWREGYRTALKHAAP